MFTEKGGNSELLTGDFGYDNFVNFSLSIKQLLDSPSTAYRVGAEKSFNVYSGETPLNLVPYVKTTCLDNFYDITKCPSNSVFGLAILTSIKDYSIRLSGEYHKGEGKFKDALIGKLKLNFNLF